MFHSYNYYTVEWSNLTFIFFFAIVILSYFLPKIKTKIKVRIGSKTLSISVGLFLLEAILIFVKGFNTSGRDLISGYYLDFYSASSMSEFRDQSIEKGYILLNVFVYNIINQYWVFLFIVALLTIIPVFKMIQKYSDVMDVSIAAFLYTAVFYYPGFSLVRISLAASIGLLAFDAMIEKKPKIAVLGIVLAAFFHTSMLCLFIPHILMFVKKFDKKLIFVLVIGIFGTVYFNQEALESLLSGRYAIYSLADTRIGLEQFAYYFPMFLLLWWQKKNVIVNDRYFYTLSFCYVLAGFFMGLMQYILPVFGRAYVAFLPVCFIMAYYTKLERMYVKTSKKIFDMLILVYGIFRFYIFISQYYNADDIMPYTNVFGWRL